MEFINKTKFAAGWTMGLASDGRELMVVAVKATFLIPREEMNPPLASEQVPLTEADQFTGLPGLSAPLYETDYSHHRPMCDVLVNGSAYAPGGKPVRRMAVGLRIGEMTKTFAVIGNRYWNRSVLGLRATEPELFHMMPINYEYAFGGVDESRAPEGKVFTFATNPVGRGYSHFKEQLDGQPLPNTEELDTPVVDPGGAYRPMSLGPIGRAWSPRAAHAGTYDQEWLDNRAPLWPSDFDYRYFQSAPPDQQIRYPQGGEQVILKNLSPNGQIAFRLPTLRMPVWFVPHKGKHWRLDSAIDTLLFEPDLNRFMITWRATQPMNRSCFDMKQVIAGDMPDVWQRMKKFGKKPYYKGLGELARARRR